MIKDEKIIVRTNWHEDEVDSWLWLLLLPWDRQILWDGRDMILGARCGSVVAVRSRLPFKDT